ncbi:hypothetical protein Droror1_Dr00022465 [Drosera rotundifolia]
MPTPAPDSLPTFPHPRNSSKFPKSEYSKLRTFKDLCEAITFDSVISCVSDQSFTMKFLEYTRLNRIGSFLSNLDLGERTIKGALEAYSCKHTGTDKKLSISFENEMLDYLGKSTDTDSPSPAEYLTSRSSRKTLTYLLLTLHHIFPDHDFSAIRAHQFFNEESWPSFVQIFDAYMSEASKEWINFNGAGHLLEDLKKALDEVIKLTECEIYSFGPDLDDDPLLERGAIWSFNFFFYNKKLKRVVSFRCCCLSNLLASDSFSDEYSPEYDGEMWDIMDM